MKKKLLQILMLAIMLLINFYAKTQNRVINSEFTSLRKGDTNQSNGKVINILYNALEQRMYVEDLPKNVGEGGSITITLKNFNPFLYNISIKEKQNTYLSEQKIIENNNIISFTQLNFEIKDLYYNSGNITTTSSQYKDNSITIKKTETLNRINEINIKRSELKDLNDLHESANKAYITSQNAADSARNLTLLNEVKAKIKILNKGIDSTLLENQNTQNEIDNLVKQSNFENDKILRYNEKVIEFATGLNKINKISSFYRSLINQIYVDGIDKDALVALKTRLLFDYFPAIKTDSVGISRYFNELVQASQESYGRLNDFFNQAASSITNDPVKKQITDNYNDIKSLYKTINFENLSKFIDYVERIYLSINKFNYTIGYNTFIISDDADRIQFTIEATPVNNLPVAVPVKPLRCDFAIPITGGVKIDLSTGLFANFGLFDKSYRYEEVSAGKFRVVENDTKNIFVPTLGVLLHLYKRNGLQSHRPNFCLGIGTSDAQRFRYYTGFSWIVGRQQRFVFSGGIVGGQVNYADPSVLGKELTLSQDNLTKPIPLRNPAPFRVGAFIGFTFNLTGNNASFLQKLNGN